MIGLKLAIVFDTRGVDIIKLKNPAIFFNPFIKTDYRVLVYQRDLLLRRMSNVLARGYGFLLVSYSHKKPRIVVVNRLLVNLGETSDVLQGWT